MASALIYVAAVASAATNEAASSCSPTCTGELPGILVPDPVNCGRYYVCLQDGLPSDFPFECDDGKHFDSGTKTCTDGAFPCDLCEPKCSVYSCPPDETGLISVADANDCGMYYLCGIGDEPMHIKCPEATPFFNGKECVKDASECCDPCRVYCSEAFTQIPDPADCTSYYFCLDVGFPGPADLHRCEEGNFNATAGHCDPAAPCEQVARCAAAVVEKF
ncbi:uncharacterized protein LOC125037161 isoform X2 [Penaeus chinensis]|uniref:uncharacterized protein LOC125037161 isoform X2 n=1 Tax=Penaeus chinensis TaxID=139456 RepID=UPI001FB73B82|nr:uncharacterized protein LOC125037161 isoform X2 [Penaeus chinensis]